jgi:hypothetical protein
MTLDMTLLTDSHSLARTRNGSHSQLLHQSPLLQPKGNGDAVTGSIIGGRSPMVNRESPVAKSWAHFVAGGYAFLLYSRMEVCTA